MARLLCVAFALAASAAGCVGSDVGTCCQALPGRNPELIPVPKTNAMGQFIDDISQDPAFDCFALTCVSFRGSMAYCTEPCQADDGCPDGFSCMPVLQSDPGPDAPIKPTDKFCVRPESQATCEQ
jgi:hypothetical protein